MSKQALLQHVAQSSLKASKPVIKTGQTVRVHQRIREGDKERTQVFEGLVIATNGGTGINGTFTVRKVMGGVGVEKVFPLHGATLPKIEVVKEAKVRRSKMYYMRGLQGKAARLQETYLNDAVFDEDKLKKEAEAAAKAEEEKAAAEAEAAKKAEEEAAAKEEAKKPAEEKAEDKKEEVAEENKEEAAEEKKEEEEAKDEAPTEETKDEAPAEEAKEEEEKKEE